MLPEKRKVIKNIGIVLVSLALIFICFHENSRLAMKHLLKQLIRAIT